MDLGQRDAQVKDDHQMRMVGRIRTDWWTVSLGFTFTPIVVDGFLQLERMLHREL